VTSFDRSIPPGGEGKIALKFNSKGYSGRVRRTATVYTNDPKAPQETIVFEAMVKTPIMISESMVLLKGTHQENVTKTVDVKGELKEPLRLEPVEFTLDKKAKFNIEEVIKGKHFRVTFTSIPNVGNSYRGLLKLKTNYPEKPELVIYVMGKFIY